MSKKLTLEQTRAIKSDFLNRHKDLTVVDFSLRVINALYRLDKRKVFVNISGGKDSTVLAHLFTRVISQNREWAERTVFFFADEEGIFPCVEERLLKLREKVLSLGANFVWTKDEFSHYCAVDFLDSGTMYRVFDKDKKDVWMRNPPEFAVKFYMDEDASSKTYQNLTSNFIKRNRDYYLLCIGSRASESPARRNILNHTLIKKDDLLCEFLNSIPEDKHDDVMCLALSTNFGGISAQVKSKNCKDAKYKNVSFTYANHFYPILYWSNSDVWYYIKQYNLDIPDVYFYLYTSGVCLKNLRVSHVFSPDTIRSLGTVALYYPNFYDKIIERMPGASAVFHFLGSELFPTPSSDSGTGKVNRTALEEFYTSLLNSKNYENTHEMLEEVKRIFEYSQKTNVIGMNRLDSVKTLSVIFSQFVDILLMYESLVSGTLNSKSEETSEEMDIRKKIELMLKYMRKRILETVAKVFIIGDPKDRMIGVALSSFGTYKRNIISLLEEYKSLKRGDYVGS